MTRPRSVVLPHLGRRLLYVSLACTSLFVLDRFSYNAFGFGKPYHHSVVTVLGLLVIPCIAYWVVLFRSPLLAGHGKAVRGFTFVGIAALLTVVFVYSNVLVFGTVGKWSGVQFW